MYSNNFRALTYPLHLYSQTTFVISAKDEESPSSFVRMSSQSPICLCTIDVVGIRILACDRCLMARLSHTVEVLYFVLILLQNYMYVGSCIWG